MVVYSALYDQYVAIYKNLDTGKNTISKFDTPEMANDFLESMAQKSNEAYWWNKQ